VTGGSQRQGVTCLFGSFVGTNCAPPKTCTNDFDLFSFRFRCVHERCRQRRCMTSASGRGAAGSSSIGNLAASLMSRSMKKLRNVRMNAIAARRPMSSQLGARAEMMMSLAS
jgi:hypothetical protein